jgi:hypothetical protein
VRVLLVLFTRNVEAPVESNVIPDTRVILPYIAVNALDPMNVPVNHVQSILLTSGAEAIITSPEPLLASKYTFSHIGTLAPLAPHELVAQFVVESQYPFPHDTQYLLTAGFPDHPMFPDTNVLFAPSSHVAPPVTPIS